MEIKKGRSIKTEHFNLFFLLQHHYMGEKPLSKLISTIDNVVVFLKLTEG